MKLINPLLSGDYHLHSSTFSDGFNSLDEMVIEAGKAGLKEIAVTDHCQAYLDSYGFFKKTHYSIVATGRWRNIHNEVRVIFGVEADLLNENGDICFDIQGFFPEFVILSTHKMVYAGKIDQIKKGYLLAIKRFGSKINLLGHLCTQEFAEYLRVNDITEIVQAANEAGIALELNCGNLLNKKTCEANLKAMLFSCASLYVNSDAHTLHEMRHSRQEGFKYFHSVDR